MKRLLRDVARRVMLVAGRAVLRLTDDATRLQTLQVDALPGETLDGVERLQPYGLSGHALPGADVLLLSMGGQRQHSIAAVVDDRRYRPREIEEGEVVVYSHLNTDDVPHCVHLLENGQIHLKTGRTTLEIEDRGMTLRCPSGTHYWGTKD